MRVQTYWLTLDYGHGSVFTIYGLSRVALKRYIDWYLAKQRCAIDYGKGYIKVR